MNEELELVTTEEIQNLIYNIRGKQVMLDSDVANLYNTETKKINQTVKRNIERFPDDFCFLLNEKEFNSLRSQIVTLKKSARGQHKKYLPYVFTEQGIIMLSGLLKSEIAIKVSVKIVEAFVKMRHFLSENGQVFERLSTIEYKLIEHDKRIEKVFDLMQPKMEINQKIFFQGQIYDAYSLIVDLILKANSKIVIIDNYADKSLLDMLTKKKSNVEAVIITSSNNHSISNLDIQKFNKEYSILKLTKTDKFHDRFIILDNKELYHCGASIKDLGKKCFGINKIEDKKVIDMLLS